MAKRGPEEIIELAKKLESLLDKLLLEKNEIAKEYSNISLVRDARISVYSKLINSCNSLHLALTFISENLLNHQWWEKGPNKSMSENNRRIYAQEFESFSKIGFIQVIFSSIESSFRLYLRKLAPNACKNGTAGFESIYGCLFHSHLATVPSEGIEVLDLLRNIRNTIHNNGVYYHENGGDYSVAWRSTTYKFEYGKAVNFVTWDLIFLLIDAIGQLVIKVVKDPALKAISDEITDPFALR